MWWAGRSVAEGGEISGEERNSRTGVCVTLHRLHAEIKVAWGRADHPSLPLFSALHNAQALPVPTCTPAHIPYPITPPPNHLRVMAIPLLLLKTESHPSDPYRIYFTTHPFHPPNGNPAVPFHPTYIPVLHHRYTNAAALENIILSGKLDHSTDGHYSALIVTSQRAVEALGAVLAQLKGLLLPCPWSTQNLTCSAHRRSLPATRPHPSLCRWPCDCEEPGTARLRRRQYPWGRMRQRRGLGKTHTRRRTTQAPPVPRGRDPA